MPAPQAEGIEPGAASRSMHRALPPDDALVDLALRCRPDLQAYRLGVMRSQADVKLALANRFADVYLLYQPYTYQDTDVHGQKPSRPGPPA